MEVLVDRVAGLDVHKKTVTACVRVPGEGRERVEHKQTFPTFRADLEEMRDWLTGHDVSLVVMEATGVFWKPVWMILEDAEVFEFKLVNARHVKQVPGRKTDVGDAAWLARLAECGLLRGSFIPPREIRELRDLTRYKKRLIQDRTREGQRVEKVLEDTGIKMQAVASKTLGVSGRAMLDAIITGERDPEVLADLARGRLRERIDDLVRALQGDIGTHHVDMLRLHLAHIDYLTAAISELDTRIDQVTAPFSQARDRLVTIPGIGKQVAETVLAECGPDMSVFPTAGRVVGRVVPRQRRVRRQAPLRQDPSRQRVALRRAHPSRVVRSPHRHVHGRPVQAALTPARQEEGHRRRRPHHPHGHLACPQQ